MTKYIKTKDGEFEIPENMKDMSDEEIIADSFEPSNTEIIEK